MKYNSKLPDESVNIPKESLFIQALKLLAVLVFSAFLLYAILKLVLHLTIDNLPPSFEKRLTSLVAMDIDVGEIRSNDYIDQITTNLAKCADLPYDVKTYIIPETTLNAFALPGGTIYITRGMLRSIKSQNELVSVIGHEMGHFKNRHHLKSLGTSLLFSILSLTLGDGYGTILNTTLDISNIKYSQAAELEADEFAIDVMECAYGSVNGVTALFSRLDNGDEWSYFFATHPAFSERLKLMKKHIEDKGYDTKKPLIPLKEKF